MFNVDKMVLPISSCLKSKELWLSCLVSLCYSLYFVFFCVVFSKDYNLTVQDIAVVSANYFTNEKSGYPANTMTMLFNSQKFMKLTRSLVCVSKNETTTIRTMSKIRYALSPVGVCEWSTYLLTCPVVENMQKFALTDTHLSSKTVRIPHRVAVKKPMGVVACFSPLFYNERWQLIIPTLEIYRQLGVDLQNYYIQSMLSEIFDFLKVYERLGIVHIETWNQLQLDKERLSALGYDPNAEFEWRNQATAHSDCFLHYKQAADFIIVSDIDDILFPKLGNNYLQEFHRVMSAFPLASSFAYSRYNTELVTSQNHEDFSLSALVDSARISNQWEDGKYVVIPKHAESAWLHWPGVMKPGRKFYVMDDKINIMVHFRNWSMTNNEPRNKVRFQRSFPLFKYQIANYAEPTNTSILEHNFQKFLQKHAQKEFERLPREIYYYPLVEQCYDRIFYSKAKVAEFCPGPLRCELPEVKGLKCEVAQRKYTHKFMNSKVKFHYPIATNGNFETSHNGCVM